MFLTNVQHLFCNSSTGTKTVFPHKIYLPRGDLPLENEIAVVMSKAFGHRKRKYEFIINILIMFIGSINCTTFEVFGKWIMTEIVISMVFATYHNEWPSIHFNLAMYD